MSENIGLNSYEFRRAVGKLIPQAGVCVAFTPTLAQGIAVAFDGALSRAVYVVLGSLVWVQAALKITGAGTAGQTITIGGLPYSAVSASYAPAVGSFRFYNGTWYAGACVVNHGDASKLSFVRDNATNYLGVSQTLANGNELSFEGWYQRA